VRAIADGSKNVPRHFLSRRPCASEPGAGRWQDPFAVEGVHLATSPVSVEGELAGAPAELVIDPRVVPHLWGVTNRFVITVAGDLDRAELIQVAQSLR
jgi:hypothetical protein